MLTDSEKTLLRKAIGDGVFGSLEDDNIPAILERVSNLSEDQIRSMLRDYRERLIGQYSQQAALAGTQKTKAEDELENVQAITIVS